MKEFLVWFKYNKNRSIPIFIGILILILVAVNGKSYDLEVGFFLFAITLPFFLIPEIKKYSKRFINYYKSL